MVPKIILAITAFANVIFALPFPEVVAQLPGATPQCHETCGKLIVESRKCRDNICLCSPGSPFMSLSGACLECGWQLWTYYGRFLQVPLGRCNLPTEPTGPKPEVQPVATSAVPVTSASAKEQNTTPAPEISESEIPALESTTMSILTEKSQEPFTEKENSVTASVSSNIELSTSINLSSIDNLSGSTTTTLQATSIATVTDCSSTACHLSATATTTNIGQVNGAAPQGIAGAVAAIAGVAVFF